MDINFKFHDYSNVYVECSEDIFFEMREHFAFFAEGYQFNPKFKFGAWDGKIRLLDYNRLLPFGLIEEAVKFARQMDYKVSIDNPIKEKEPITKESLNAWLNKLEIYSGSNRIKPHWYQVDAVFEGLYHKRRILNLPTSAGKSLIQALLSRYYLENNDGAVLIIVPTVALVTQMKEDFIDYRLFDKDDIAEMRGGKTANGQPIVVSTWQTAVKQEPEWFTQFGMMLCDEMHLATGMSISKIIKGLTCCQYKMGLSGSLKDGKSNLMQYKGLFGEVFKPVSTAQLMEEGQVTDLNINCLMLRYPEEVQAALKGRTYQEEIKYITSSKARNKIVCDLAQKLKERDQNSFLMFKNIAHGKMIYDELKGRGLDNVYYVSGEVDAETRSALKHMAESQSGVIVVASYGVFSTGISVKNLHHVILAHPVKSKVIVLQTIGRVLRKHDSKSVATVWDIIDDFSKLKTGKDGKVKRTDMNYALKHGVERIERYASEKFKYIIKKLEIK